MRRPGQNRVFSFFSGTVHQCGRLIDQLFVLRAQQPRPHSLRLEALEDRSVTSTTTLTLYSASIDRGQNDYVTATVTGVSPTGTVTFMDGSTVLGTVGLSANGSGGYVSSFVTSNLSIGTHTITAVYNGDANNAASTSNSVTETVSLDHTATTLTATRPTINLGQSTSLTATVSSSAIAPTGTVTFTDGSTVIGTVSVAAVFVGGGDIYQATLNGWTPSSAGTHTITAVYNGDANTATSTSNSVTETVNTGTTTTLTSSGTSTYRQPMTFTATVASNSGTPTGTVTFMDGTKTLGTGTLNGTGTATFTTTSLAVGTHSITASYAGVPGFLASQSAAVSVTITTARALQNYSDYTANPLTCPGTLADFSTALGNLPAATTNAPVRFADGSNQITATDLSSDAFGQLWGVGRSWSNNPQGFDAGSPLGTGWVMTQQPRLFLNQSDLVMVADATTAYDFSHQGTPDANGNYPSYIPQFGGPGGITYDSTHDQFVLTDGVGDQLRFNGFGSSWTAGQQGALASMTNAAGVVTTVTAWTAAGWPAEVQQSATVGGVTVINSYVYTYLAPKNPNAGDLASVVLRQKTGAGSWQTVQQVVYQYYDGTTSNGNLGNLERATVEDASGNVLSEDYYRYYTSTVITNGVQTGYQGGLEYVLQPDAYARLKAAAGGTDAAVDAASNATVAAFADNYFQYDSTHRVSEEVAAGQGCSACSGGLGTYTFSYTTSTNAAGFNSWSMKTVVSMPNGAIDTEYTNAYGDVMLSAIKDPTTGVSNDTYYRYDNFGHVILRADPSGVTGYNDTYADLVNYGAGGSTYLSSNSGVFTVHTYYASTTATATSAGGVAGFEASTGISQGQLGTVVAQEAWTYFQQTVNGATDTPVAADTVYRNADGTGAQTTSYAYTWYSGTTQEQSVTTTLPAVTTAENGSGTANTTAVVYDTFGRVVWTKDAGGFIRYTTYDPLTGAVTETISDVNTLLTGEYTNLPTGWSTPTGAGLNLITTYQVDSQGRVTKQTDPNGEVTYTVYDDVNHAVRRYAGWNSTTNKPTGPTEVIRQDWANGYTETLTMSASPAVSGGVPTGTEAIANIQSLSRSYTNAAGQVIYTDNYFNLSGLTYSTSTNLGTQGVNFYRTQYAYDESGRLNKSVSSEGTIYRTVYDDLGRAVSKWVGTNDTPTSGEWSPTNNTGTSNMVEVASYVYDNGGVGDGNLTQVTQYPGGGAANRVTNYWYDWRDRLVAVKDGVQTTEATGVNRPLVVYTYDNLNEVTQTQVYTADGVAPTISGGVLSLSGVPAANLRAQTATSFDELGRVYRTDTYDVNPTTGAVGPSTLYSLMWYDPRGNVIETLSPGGLVTKTHYDGAGRVTVEYTTDGGGGTGYAAAGLVGNDTVLEQKEFTYDANGNVIETVDRQRFDNATGTGVLGSPTSGIGARVSYMGYYYDLANRLVASVDVGTNGGTAWTMPTTPPASSSVALVTTTSYSTDAVQDVTLTGSPTGGTFTLSFGGYTTSAIAYNASAATVQSALAALTSIGSGNVAVIAAPGGGWEVRFTGTLANTYQVAITGNGSGLTGGTSPNVSVATISYGGDAGRAAQVTDPAGRVTRTYTDALGRTVRTVQDFTDGVVTNSSNATTGYTYNSVGTTSLTAYLTNGGVQTTAYVYGVTTAAGSGINSNDIVGKTQFPDKTTGAPSSSQQETTTVDALGETLTATDRNGNVHTLTYDVLGRVVSDAVTTLGTGVDGSVRRIDTAYDGQGNAYLITSYNATSGGSIVNQVERVYNGLGQLTAEYQSHSGAVNTSTTPSVQYSYSEMSGGADNSRLTAITYPDGYVLTENYLAGLNNTISRLSSLSDSTGTLEAYKYLGLDTVVERDHPQINVNQTLISQTGGTGDAGDQYVGLDRFGRVVDDLWINTSTSTTTDEFKYALDLVGKVTAMTNVVNSSFNQSFTYDNLDQLLTFTQGTHTQNFNYDAVGNATSVTTDGTTQTRSANAQNQYTSISGATTPTYDSNGNMTTDETGRQFVYDAWNRLVAVKNSSGTTLETFSYDGLGRRVTQTASGITTDVYYSTQHQVLEEMVGGSATARYVWSPEYVNALILRDRATGAPGTLNERLWVQQDANWNVTALVNGSGVVVERYVYDPYGKVTIYSPDYSTVRTSSSYAMNYLYQGMWYDSTSGLYKAIWRWYSPTLQRWTSTDPIGFFGGNVNLYGFVGQHPTDSVDPSGLAEHDDPAWVTIYDSKDEAPPGSDQRSSLRRAFRDTATNRTKCTIPAESWKDALAGLSQHVKDHGKIKVLYIIDHGTPPTAETIKQLQQAAIALKWNGRELEKRIEDENQQTFGSGTNTKILQATDFAKLKPLFAEDATIILGGCSVAQSSDYIDGIIKATGAARVIASKTLVTYSYSPVFPSGEMTGDWRRFGQPYPGLAITKPETYKQLFGLSSDDSGDLKYGKK